MMNALELDAICCSVKIKRKVPGVMLLIFHPNKLVEIAMAADAGFETVVVAKIREAACKLEANGFGQPIQITIPEIKPPEQSNAGDGLPVKD